ncbi:MAG: DUF58 domain-containing protein [Acidobacteriota bacterium]
MIPKDILRKVRHIEIRTNRVVNESLAGRYSSVFRGRGMEFSEVREYQPGDDVRTIDWNVTSRMGQPYIKKHVEERELTVMLGVDCSASGWFGTTAQTKGEVAAEVAALIAFTAIKNNDRVGLLLFTDQVELYVPPAKGVDHVLRVVREILIFKPRHRRTDLALGLDTINHLVRKRAVVFLVSDFLDEGFDRQLRLTARRHDLVAVLLSDPREATLPRVGLLRLQDAETGREAVIDTGWARVRSAFRVAAERRMAAREELLHRVGVDRIAIRTDAPYERPLLQFFRQRERRFQ